MPEPVMGSLALRLAAVLVLVAANAFFVAAEFALVAARRTRIEEMIRRGDRKAKTVQQALQDLYRQLSAAQLGITVASILLGYVAEDTVAHLFREWFAGLPPALDFLTRGGIASIVAVAIISFLHVVFGEQAPKAWAITYPEKTSRWIARPLILFSWITRPLTDALNWSANRVVRLLGIRGTTAELERIHSPEEIRMLVAQSRRRGGLDAGDARMLEGVFEFSEKTAREVMTPRTDMVALPLDLTLEEAADQVAVAGRSRYPVYRESLDDIVGLVHAREILAGVRSAKGGRVEAVRRPGRLVRDGGDGRAPGGRRPAGRTGGDVKLRSTIAPIPPPAHSTWRGKRCAAGGRCSEPRWSDSARRATRRSSRPPSSTPRCSCARPALPTSPTA